VTSGGPGDARPGLSVTPVTLCPAPCGARRFGQRRRTREPGGRPMSAPPREPVACRACGRPAAHEGGHNKQIALIISVRLWFWRSPRPSARASQTAALNITIEASTCGIHEGRPSAHVHDCPERSARVDGRHDAEEARKAALSHRSESGKTAARYRPEPGGVEEKGEGTVELMRRCAGEEKGAISSSTVPNLRVRLRGVQNRDLARVRGPVDHNA